MTKPGKSEFEERHRRYSKAVTPSVSVAFVLVFIAIFWWQFSATAAQSFDILTVITGIAVACFWYFYLYLPKKYGLNCSHCGKSIIRHRRADQYIESNECPWCHERVWLDDQNSADDD